MATERELSADMSTEELISAMEGNTQIETFNSALMSDEDFEKDISGELKDDAPDTSLEDIEKDFDEENPQDEEDGDEQDNPDDEAAELAGEDDEAPDQAPAETSRIPSSRLREETARRQAIEQERDTLRAQLAAYQVAQQQAQQRSQPQYEQPAKPDIFSDPDAWAADYRAQIERDFTARHVNAALAEAHETHGDEFVAAYRQLTSLNPADPIARATVQRIWDAPNPGKSLMRWYGEQQILREAGGDPSAYKQRVAREIMSDPEFRRQILSDMRGEAQRGDGGRPRTTTRLPKSLNGASGGGSVRTGDPELYNNSEDSVFAFAMK